MEGTRQLSKYNVTTFVYTIYPDSTLFPRHCADIHVRGKDISRLGVLHPEVLTAFDINMPASALKIDTEPKSYCLRLHRNAVQG